MRFDRFLLIAVLVLLSFSAAYGACTTGGDESYPGWEPRFNGSLVKSSVVKDGVNGTVGMGDLSVEVLDILGGEIANLRVSQEDLFEEDFSVTRSQKNFDLSLENIRITVVSVAASTVNLTIYTHDQAIVNISTNITYQSSDLNSSLPGEKIEIESEVKNIGELEAEGLQIIEDFGDLEVISRDVTLPNSFCPNSTFKIVYDLRAPSSLREDTNYTMYFEFRYSDSNVQLQSTSSHTKRIPHVISIKPASVKINKDNGNWTLLNQGNEQTIFNRIENIGNTTVYDVELVDTPPSDLMVVSGQPSLTVGRLEPGDKKTRSYTLISNDPIFCASSSKVNYKDELDNSYTTYSEMVGVRFSPFVTITKTIRDNPIFQNLTYGYPIKTRRSMRSDYSDTEPVSVNFTADAIMKTYEGIPYFSLCQGTFLNGSPQVCIGDKGKVTDNNGEEPKVLINRSSEITVEIKNIGNTIARDIRAEERLKNIDGAGILSWNGTLSPGETATYTYLATPTQRAIDLTTDVSYLDVEPLSLSTPEIEGFSVGVCTKKLRNVTFSSSGNFSTTYADLKIDAPELITVYENSPFDFQPIIYNNGTERLYDLEITEVFGDLTLVKGQRTVSPDDLGRGFKPWRIASCNVDEWNTVNISKTVRHAKIAGVGKNEITYEIRNGKVRVFVDGVPTSIEDQDCEKDGLKIKHDVSIVQRYPFHVPPEPQSTTKTTKEVTMKFYGNPLQRDLSFMTPFVENDTYIPLTTIVSYQDFYGNRYERRYTSTVLVVPSTATFVIVRKERSDLGLIVNYTNETELGEPGELNLELVSKGFGPIDRYVLNLTLPIDIEIATNDSNWTGRVEAEIKIGNQTLNVYSGDIARTGNISQGKSAIHRLTIRGLRAGTYEIPYKISYDGKTLEGKLPFKVKGPILSASKKLSAETAQKGDEITVTVNVKNTGEGDALNVVLNDRVPASNPLTSGSNQASRDRLKPGEEITLTYVVKASSTANMGGTVVSWEDLLGNAYTGDLQPLTLKVIQPSTKPSETKAPSVETPAPSPSGGKIFPEQAMIERPGVDLTSPAGLGLLALSLIVLIIVVKLITIKTPVKEDEE